MLAFRAHVAAKDGKGIEQPKELAPLTDEQGARDKDLLQERRKQSAGPIRAVNTECPEKILQLTDHRLEEQASDNSCKACQAVKTKGA